MMCRFRWSVAVVVVAFFDDGGGSDDIVGSGFAASRLNGDAERKALPFGGLADGDEVVGLGPFAEELLDDGAAGS